MSSGEKQHRAFALRALYNMHFDAAGTSLMLKGEGSATDIAGYLGALTKMHEQTKGQIGSGGHKLFDLTVGLGFESVALSTRFKGDRGRVPAKGLGQNEVASLKPVARFRSAHS